MGYQVSAYVLDLQGIQENDTIFNRSRHFKNHKKIIFEPTKVCTDHSLEDCSLPLKAGLTTYTTEPYISMTTGNRCIISAVYFRDNEGC
jgi:hypothetical protein